MNEPLADRVAAVAALDEPTRRRLYEYVVRRPAPVSRDEVVAALHIPRASVAFHLDKLVGEHLLAVTYQRRTGRQGPGAGRPAKLYHRSERPVSVSLPERHYDLAGHLLAATLEEADRSGQPARTILERHAHQLGEELGETIRTADRDGPGADRLLLALDRQGYEPRTQGDQVFLGNCPFHALAQAHTDLVCGMNLSLLDGLLAGLDQTGMRAHLDPTPGHCCVRLAPVST